MWEVWYGGAPTVTDEMVDDKASERSVMPATRREMGRYVSFQGKTEDDVDIFLLGP